MAVVRIAEKGRALLPILVPINENELIPVAKELAHFLRRITGADFAIEEKGNAGLFLSVNCALEEEEILLKTDGQGVYIQGGSLRGVFYGVYTLLEDVLGVGFFTEDVTDVPSLPDLAIEDLFIQEKPDMEYRHTNLNGSKREGWFMRNRLNQGKDEAWGGGLQYALFVHTFHTLVPPGEFFQQHPEYFSLVNGQRRKDAQLCLTNPEVKQIVIQRVKEILRRNPQARFISVSQNDGYTPCECPECARIDQEEGSHAGTLIRFVNDVAESIEAEFPRVVVDTLAYQYTRRPPRIARPRHNVCVRLCSIECCFSHPLESCTQCTSFAKNEKTSSASFQEDLAGWGRICDRVYIWDYVTNFKHYWLPFPNFHVLGPNMRFYRDHGVKGMYAEGNYQSVAPDLNEMRAWLLAKLMWNADFNVQQGICRFAQAVYGPAAEEICAYIRLLEKRVTEGQVHMGIYGEPNQAYLDENTLSQARGLLTQALKKDLSLSQRIYTERVDLSLEFVGVTQNILQGKIDGEAIDRIFEKGRLLGITHISEWVDWETARRDMLEGKLYGRCPCVV